jgi:hypothetical protein
MHYLLIPYLLLGSLFVLQFHARKDVSMRTGLVVTALVTVLMLCIAIAARPVTGDSWRYYQYFSTVRNLPLGEALQYRDPDALYALLNWLLGQLGQAPWILYSGVLTIYVGVSVYSLRRRFTTVDIAILSVCMTAYPFFIAYAANGLRQGIGLAFLFAGYVGVRGGRKSAWIWVFLAPFWHSAIWLAVGVLVIHQLMCALTRNHGLRWGLVLGAWLVSLMLVISGLNTVLGKIAPSLVEIDRKYEIYFMDPSQFGYAAGFRPDFTLFSLLPLATAIAFRRSGKTLDYRTIAGWMLSLYLSLNIIYNLFSFAPFADRFAAFSWWLMPFVVFLQVRAVGSKRLMSIFATGIVVVNALMLQLYTGNFLPAPDWLQ